MRADLDPAGTSRGSACPIGVRHALTLLLLVLPATAGAQPAGGQLAGVHPGPRRTVHARLARGLAYVQVRHRIAGRGETTLDEPLPEGAGLAGFEVCRAGSCRRSVVDPFVAAEFDAGLGDGITASVEQLGDRLEIRARSRQPGPPITLTLRYVAPTELAGRDVQLVLPPYPDGATRISASAPGLDGVSVEGSAGAAPRPAPTRVTARLAAVSSAAVSSSAVSSSAVVARCDDARCARYWVAAPGASVGARDVFLFLDVSPSMSPVEPAHRAAVVQALLSSMPAGSTVRRVAFAWRAVHLDRAGRAPDDVNAAEALPRDLGPSTRISAAWELIAHEARTGRRPLVIVIGDGTLAYWPSEQRALDEMVAAGVELASIDLVGRRDAPRLYSAVRRTGGLWTDQAPTARTAGLGSVYQPQVVPNIELAGRSLGPLRAGQELVHTSRDVFAAPLRIGARHRRARGLGEPWSDGLVVANAVHDGRRDARMRRVALGASHVRRIRQQAADARRAARRMGAPRRAARLPQIRIGRAVVRGSVSRQVIRRHIRRGMPAVNECFRRFRVGHPYGLQRVTVRLLLANGEILGGTVTSMTTADPSLERCLLDEALARFPSFPQTDEPTRDDGLVVINYPFLSRGLTRPAQIPLDVDVAGLVDAIGEPE